ncbi:PTS glucose transporter subunit IIA [Virgibacillus xinjiangensis]|uniref:PTS glucose transporter subunit IIA n=1 Tax=Virgibacillus xinjiangensis TaxID=393090 RepID=A0ABV7CW65_9BACI
MFGKLFKKKEEVTVIALTAPVNGKTVALEDVPDPVFAQKMMGDGIAVEPADGEVVAPVDGKIVQVFPTKHAVGILAENGSEILIHIGLETVSLDGEGFISHVEEGDRVKQGDSLISFDLEVVGEKAKSTVTPMIVTNTDDMSEITIEGKDAVTAGKDELVVVKK